MVVIVNVYNEQCIYNLQTYPIPICAPSCHSWKVWCNFLLQKLKGTHSHYDDDDDDADNDSNDDDDKDSNNDDDDDKDDDDDNDDDEDDKDDDEG